ncbi:MAG: carotenoid biosynthesis protein [Nitrospiraceae bacterium]
MKTIQLRLYVFVFFAAFLFSAQRLLGWRRTGIFLVITWVTAFVCEFSSTRTGIPFGWYHYTGSTVGQELYLSNVPFMDSLSFSFLLYASYCLALLFLLPVHPQNMDPRARGRFLPAFSFDLRARTGWPVLVLAPLLFAFIDIVIDPVALRGDRWFLGKIYYYPDPGIHFGVPIANYVGWGTVGVIALLLYILLDRKLPPLPIRSHESVTGKLLLGCGLYYGVLIFNLTMTFWIEEPLLGTTGLLTYIPITVLLLLRLLRGRPSSLSSQ